MDGLPGSLPYFQGTPIEGTEMTIRSTDVAASLVSIVEDAVLVGRAYLPHSGELLGVDQIIETTGTVVTAGFDGAKFDIMTSDSREWSVEVRPIRTAEQSTADLLRVLEQIDAALDSTPEELTSGTRLLLASRILGVVA